MKVADWLNQATQALQAAALECADPRLHARQILEGVTGWTAAQCLTRSEAMLDKDQLAELTRFLARRTAGEPYQYILGREWFWKDVFEVGPGVLIPRRETEHVVSFLAALPLERARVVELGAGTGNIGISVLREKPNWEWFSCEKSEAAAAYASKNSSRLLAGTGARYFLAHADFFDFAPKFAPWDVVVSNPPYVATHEIAGLSREVRHEPPSALDGGMDGLGVVRQLAESSIKLLKSGGWLVLEIGSDQQAKGLEILNNLGYEQVSVIADLAGLPRVLVGQR
jgi:release factor glutamine methyltransferase